MNSNPSNFGSLSVSLFGSFGANINGAPLPRLRTSRGRSLLALLILRRGSAVDRSWIAGTLWPESDEARAAANLRRTLNDLRHALGEQAWRIGSVAPRSLNIDLAGAEVDTADFDVAVAGGKPEDLQVAIDNYKGPLLEGISEPWVLPEREVREQAYLAALEKLADIALSARDLVKAIPLYRRILALDPYQEHIYCQLMQALADIGDTAAAERVYRDLRTLLLREMNLQPGDAAAEVYNRIKSRDSAVSCRKASEHTSSLAAANMLPRLLTPLLGRETELADLQNQLLRGGLLTVVGLGGVGKTSLIIEAARNLSLSTPVRFVRLASIDKGSILGAAIAAALGVQEQKGKSIVDAIIEYIRNRRLLLVLDNCEHLLGDCRVMAQTLLERCENLTIAATSRLPLGVSGEQVWQLGGLSAPGHDSKQSWNNSSPADQLLSYGAVRLFVERARQTDRHFTLDNASAADIVTMCRMLDGLPLSIELAAAWIGTLTAAEICSKLSQSLDILVNRKQNVEARHASAAATVEWSFHQLDCSLRSLLIRLCVFRGSWTMEAAREVCSAELIQIAELRSRSLIATEQVGAATRYRMLFSIRAFASNLAAPEDEAAVSDRHLRYYLNLAEHADEELSGSQQSGWLDLLDIENDNLRAAIHHSIRSRNANQALRLTSALSLFWWTRGYWSEGRQHLDGALALVPYQQGDTTNQNPFGLALCGSGWLSIKQGDEKHGRRHVEEALRILRNTNHVSGIGRCLIILGGLAIDNNEIDSARSMLTECYELRHTGLDEASAAAALYALGHAAMREYDYENSRYLFSKSYDMCSASNDSRGSASALMALGVIAVKSKTSDAGGRLYHALELFEELGDRRGIALTLTNIAELEFGCGSAERARELAERALEMWRDLGQPYGIADALFHLARAHYSAGNVNEGLTLFRDSAHYYVKVHHRLGLARVLTNVAMHYEQIGDTRHAIQLCCAANGCARGNWEGSCENEELARARISTYAMNTLGEAQTLLLVEQGKSLPGGSPHDIEAIL